MPDSDPNSEKEALIQGYVEGALTPQESARLHDLMREDPLLARVIVDHLRTDGVLREIVGEKEKALGAAVPEEPTSEAPNRRSSRRNIRFKDLSRPGRSSFPFQFVGVLAAACLLLLVGLVLHGNRKTTTNEAPKREEAARHDGESRRRKMEDDRRAAEEEERRALENLRKLEFRREALTKRPPPPVPDPAVERQQKSELATLDLETERLKREMQEAAEKARKARENLARIPEKPVETPRPEERPTPVPERSTRVVVAKVERVEGDVTLHADGRKTALKAPHDLMTGQGLETAGGSAGAVVTFGDETRVALGSETWVRDVKVEGGKRFTFERGRLWANVENQPKDQPLVFVTPHADATVRGTSLRILTDRNQTYLEVTKGKVELTRKATGETVLVESGHYAVAAAGVTLAAKPLPQSLAEIVLESDGAVAVNFGPANLTLPEKFEGKLVVNDAAPPFDPARGYGWEGKVWAGLSQGTFADPLHASFVGGGGAQEIATWRLRVPNGTYQVTICVGGPGMMWPEQGPHHVAIEGKLVFDAVKTEKSGFLQKVESVTVTDGDLTLVIGGHKNKTPPASDGTADTVINYITVRRVKK